MTDNCYRTVHVALKMLQRDNHRNLEAAKALQLQQSIKHWQDQVVETRLAMDEMITVWAVSMAASFTINNN